MLRLKLINIIGRIVSFVYILILLLEAYNIMKFASSNFIMYMLFTMVVGLFGIFHFYRLKNFKAVFTSIELEKKHWILFNFEIVIQIFFLMLGFSLLTLIIFRTFLEMQALFD